jgi:hypothetical protein
MHNRSIVGSKHIEKKEGKKKLLKNVQWGDLSSLNKLFDVWEFDSTADEEVFCEASFDKM